MHEPLCEVLLENLCSAVQKVQELFASGQEVIKDGDAVNNLCQVVGEIFSHGLKEGILNWASGSETTFWPLIAKITYKEVLQTISRIPSVKNDKERCQVWVRMACQENSLGSYLNIITQDEKLLADFYQPHAFLLDKEKVETARTALLYGLSHLDFNISLDIPRNCKSSRKGSFTKPEKSHSFNGLDSSHSSSFTYANTIASTSLSNSTLKSKDSTKKKKKVKSSVAVIADTLDEDAGIMNSVERYLYNMSSDNDNAKTIDLYNGEDLNNRNNSTTNDENNAPQRFENCGEDTNSTNDLQCNTKDYIHDNKLSSNCSETENALKSKCYRTEDSNSGLLESKLSDFTINETEDTSDNKCESNQEDKNNSNVLTTKKYADNSSCSDETTLDQKSKLINSSVSKETSSHEEQDDKQEIVEDYNYKVSRAHFVLGSPTEHTVVENSNIESLTPEENDFNFIPGIHKPDPWRSHSGSFSSLTGSGSFTNQSTATKELRRTSTMDSKTSISSMTDSSVHNESWRYVTSSLSDVERKDSRADNSSIATEDSFSDLAMFEELLGMTEDHFSSPESFMGLTSSEQFHHAIVSCKEMIKTSNNAEEKKKLVKQLIQLRMKQQEIKDEPSTENTTDGRKILGHQFMKEEDTKALTNVLCDRCGKWVWTLWQSLFTCQSCQFHSHRKCLDIIRRHCASRKVSVSSYSLKIAPESGLHFQQYKCVECRKMISLTKSGQGEARLCDYSGQYFCEDCHWNDQVVIPARIVHNWDFGTYKVSRQTKQFLDLMAKKPILDLAQLNPALFKFVGELRDIKRFREEILIMKKYFMTCRSALESKLLLHLQDKQHFVDNSSTYSLQDLLEVERGAMLPFITKIHSLFLAHIKSDCELCRAKGFVCEICKANEIIFAFDPHATQCTTCRTVFHRICFKKDFCPKCERIRSRTPK